MSSWIKLVEFLSVMFENHRITCMELVQSGRGEEALILGMIASKVRLLSLPMSDLVGLMSLMEGLLRKSGLWALRLKMGCEEKEVPYGR